MHSIPFSVDFGLNLIFLSCFRPHLLSFSCEYIFCHIASLQLQLFYGLLCGGRSRPERFVCSGKFTRMFGGLCSKILYFGRVCNSFSLADVARTPAQCLNVRSLQTLVAFISPYCCCFSFRQCGILLFLAILLTNLANPNKSL